MWELKKEIEQKMDYKVFGGRENAKLEGRIKCSIKKLFKVGNMIQSQLVS